MSLDAYINDLSSNHVALSHDEVVTLPDNESLVWDGPDSMSEHNDHETIEDDEDEYDDEWEEESEITLSESQATIDLVE